MPVVPDPPLSVRVYHFLRWLLRWIVRVALVLLVIAIGQLLEPLHRFDAAIAPHRATLQLAFGAMLVIGFVLFMGGILHMLLQREPLRLRDREIALRDLSWRDRRFLVILTGVLLLLLGGAALAIITAPPGIKLLILLACLGAPASRRLARRRPRRPEAP